MTAPTSELMDVVDTDDKVVAQATKAEIYERKLPHRIVHVLLVNEAGELLLQQRSREMAFCPGHWVTSAGGHVQAGESYSQAATRELAEELGVETELGEVGGAMYNWNGLLKHIRLFTSKHNGPFRLSQREVTRVAFFDRDKFPSPRHPELDFCINNFLNTPS